jgi:hypothetical protein
MRTEQFASQKPQDARSAPPGLFTPASSPNQPYARPGGAPWPVWSGSTRNPVRFMPMSRREAVKTWHDLRRFERQTKPRGRQDGAIGRNGLAIARAFLFIFMDRTTGALEPTRAEIARAADISTRSVDRGLAKLKAARACAWIRQCTEKIENGIYCLAQKASAYFLCPQSQWRGFRPCPEPPAPYPETWGRTPPLPDPIAAACQAYTAGAGLAGMIVALEGDPHDKLATAMAQLGRGVKNPKVSAGCQSGTERSLPLTSSFL